MSLTIRPAVPSDAEAISGLVHEVVPTLGYGAESDVALFLLCLYSPAVIRSEIESGSHSFLVAVESDSAIAGVLYLRPDTGYFGGMHVRVRRQGVGRALMDAMIELAGQLGVDIITGSVLGTNEAMLALSEMYGFRITGPDPDKEYFLTAPFMIIVRDAR